tara:strand:- start:197 stop:721 length:525 start_codon:yes stop_codon:yes gene_type:complete
MITAKASGRDLGISTKQSVEICSFIRGKTTEKAKTLLKEVIEMKRAVPFKRYNQNTGHKPGMAAGRYPVNACVEILKIVNSVESNANDKSLSTPLIIKDIKANKASNTWHYGRQRRRRMKRTHIDIIVAEKKSRQDPAKKTEPVKKTPVKKEAVKKTVIKEAPKKTTEKVEIKE